MNPFDHMPPARSRRHFVLDLGAGFGSLALSSLMSEQLFADESRDTPAANASPLAPKIPTLPSKVKSCIFLFMFGGPSQVDLFDYKPELQRNDGKTIDNEFRRGTKTKAVLQASQRTFARHGESGLWCSDALPNLAKHMDKLAVVKSLQSDSFAHGSALLQSNSGRILQGSPSIGSWVTYGLGTINQNLPGYVVMLDPRGGPTSGSLNWSSGYMPAAYQGTVFR
ncbi:MAG: DUF1501 domain-containing protein, partial [Planctomycetota bacterium]|nr:DUF1501 domain-containing protein [Planctomycetota bacterium]